MNYLSTRDPGHRVSSAKAITQGISPEGGLFVPESIPALSLFEIQALAGKSYVDCACAVLGLFLTDFSRDEIQVCVENAYGAQRFDTPQPIQLSKLGENPFLLELWHGPTCAFKDMALQLLPHLLTLSMKKTGEDREVVILTATSGDTGKAALEGFRDVAGTRIIVYYPQHGVSDVQKRQMITQEGGNVSVFGIVGNFDNAQTAVKQLFTDCEITSRLDTARKVFSSANSINWGRLAPQIVYYIYSYCALINAGEISPGEKINLVVPTGNFGNILAAFYAKQMGLPVGRLICASNANNVLTEFIKTGVYDRNRQFYSTLSPSMDILISSNLERLLFHLTDGDHERIGKWMEQLATDGKYEVDEDTKAKIASLFYGDFCDDADTKAQISETFNHFNYLPDTHTAVALRVYSRYAAQTGDTLKAVIASTASPFKFAAGVLEALGVPASGDDLEALEALAKHTGEPIPKPLSNLADKTVRFERILPLDDVKKVLLETLEIN